MNAINLSLKQREQLGIKYVESNIERVNVSTCNISYSDNIKSKTNYVIDFGKIAEEINKNNGNFYGVKMKNNTDFTIDESEQEHFTQILYIIQQDCYVGNKWIGWDECFTKKYLNDICKNDYEIYLTNWDDIGPDFVKQFPNKIDYFIDNFCKLK